MKPDTLTLEQKTARYERIIAMRGPEDAPTMSLDDIGAAFTPALSRQRVQQIIDGGRPKAHGRPRAAHNVDAKRKALALWETRRASRAEKGLPTDYAESRIATLSAELASVDGR